MVTFIDDHRETYRVEPICRVLPIAPSTYYAFKASERDPGLRSARSKRDDELRDEIQRVWDENLKVYGVRKVYKQLRREGFRAARCTVARLMADIGLRGAVRGRRIKTTSPKSRGGSAPLFFFALGHAAHSTAHQHRPKEGH